MDLLLFKYIVIIFNDNTVFRYFLTRMNNLEIIKNPENRGSNIIIRCQQLRLSNVKTEYHHQNLQTVR